MSDGDPHRLANRLKNQVERIKTSDKISSHNKGLLREFKEYMESQELTDGRISRYLSIWRIILEKGDEDLKMDEASKKDLVRIVGKINKNKIKKFAPGTKKEYKKGVRKFYTDFMAFNEPEKVWEKSCDFFSLTVKKSYLDPDRLPKPGHVEKMVKTADRMRDKTFVMALWSTGARIGAILGLKWKDIKLRHQGGKVVFRDTKTAEDRVVPLLEGYLYFRDFKEHDHRGDDPEAFVFRGVRTDDQLTHNGACMILKRLKERAEIPDRIKTSPHAFRKGRATYLSQYLTETELCKMMGWVPGSDQPRRYLRLAEQDLEDSLKSKSRNWEGDEKREEDCFYFEPVKCRSCGCFNKFEASNCKDCGTVLSASRQFTEVKVDEAKTSLRNEMIREQVGVDEEWMDTKACEIVNEKFK